MKQDKIEEQWLDEIRQTLADHKEELPADGWERLAAAMTSAEEAESAAPMLRSHIAPMWLWRAAAVILLGAIGVGGMYYFSDSPEIPASPIASVEKELPHEEEFPAMEEAFGQEQSPAQSKPSSTKQVLAMSSSASEQKIIEQEVGEEESNIQKDPAAPSPQQTAPESLSDIHQEENAVLLAMNEAPITKPSASRSWTLGLRLGRNGLGDLNLGDLSGSTDDPYYTESPIAKPTPNDSTQQTAITRAQSQAADEAVPDEVVSSENHLSWSAGISVGKQLNRYFSLESGLVYTYLSSDVSMKQAGRQHQQLHYLGIPLKLSATITEEGRWLFYANIGTMLEHSIYGKRGAENLHLNDWQWSMDGGLGLQYRMTDHMGLYVEPGVNYYFSNGTEVPSIRTESPFTFNLQIGVRFGL